LTAAWSVSVSGYELSGQIRRSLDHVQSKELLNLMRHWRDCVDAGQDLPIKSAIDPGVLARVGLLPSVWIVEVPEHGAPYYRLTGEQIRSAFGHRVKGCTIHEVFESPIAQAIEGRWRRLLKERLFSHTVGDVYSEKGRIFRGERVAVPLADHDGTPRFILGCTLYSHPAPGRLHAALKTYKERESSLAPVSLIREMA
jgi:hypothetical protein